MSMNAQQIGEALQNNPTVEQCDRLTQACESRRVEIRARFGEIAERNPVFGQPAERAKALLAGPRAVLELDVEVRLLQIENDQCDYLEMLCHQRREEAIIAGLRKEIPAAVKRLPELVEHVREMMSNYDAAIAALNRALDPIGQFASIPGGKYPLVDDQLAEVLELRNRAWMPRLLNVPHNIPGVAREENIVPSVPPIVVPGDDIVKRYPKSWALLYAIHGDVVVDHRPPQTITGPISMVYDVGKRPKVSRSFPS